MEFGKCRTLMDHLGQGADNTQLLSYWLHQLEDRRSIGPRFQTIADAQGECESELKQSSGSAIFSIFSMAIVLVKPLHVTNQSSELPAGKMEMPTTSRST